MKTLSLVLMLSLSGLSIASADPHFYNATMNKYTVVATFPNGKVEKNDIGGISAGISSSYFLLSPGVKSLKIEIFDDTGASAWKGTSNPDDSFVIIPNDKGVKVVYAGAYSGADGPAAAVFMNISGEPLKIDLEGHNGVGAHRGISPGTSWDLKKMVRLDHKESTFSILAQGDKGAEPTKIEGVVHPGYYYLLWKTECGNIQADQLGKIVVKK